VNKFLALDLDNVRQGPYWAVGCSYTSSVGVTDEERWANVLSTKLEQPVSVIAKPATSIPWAADQILRSDVQAGDTIFWLLTTTARIDYFSEAYEQVKMHPNLSVYDEDRDEIKKLNVVEERILQQLLTFKWPTYMAIKSILQVKNYCNKIGARLILGQCLINDEETDKALLELLHKDPNFILEFSVNVQQGKFKLDLGTDGVHPGPLTHKYIAEKFYDRYNRKSN